MKKHSLLFVYLLTIALFLYGCAGDLNEKANKLYVEASMEAGKFLDNTKEWDGSYSTLYDSYTSVKDRTELILSKYPSSDIAVGLLSEATKISGLTLRQFRKKEDVVKLIKEAEQSPFSSAMLLAEKTEDEEEKARILFQMALSYAAAGQEEKVTPLLYQAFQLESSATSHKSEALGSITSTYVRSGYLEQAFVLAVTIDDAGEKSSALIEIADKYAEFGEKVKTAQLLSLALEIPKTMDKYKTSHLEGIADIYINIGLLDEAFEVVKSMDDESDYFLANKKSRIFLKIAEKYIESGQKEKAAKLLSQAHNIAGNNSGLLIDVAEKYIESGQKEKASKLLSQALQKAHQDWNQWGKANNLGRIAAQYAKMGHREQAAQIFSKAFTAAESVDGEEEPFYAFVNITCMLAEVSQKEKAAHLLSQVLEETKTLKRKDIKGYCLKSVAKRFADLGLLDQAAAVSLTKGVVMDYSDIFINIAGQYADHGQIDKAFDFIKSIDSLYTKSSVLIEIVDKYVDLGQKHQSIDWLSEILKVTETMDSTSDGKPLTLYEISQLYSKAGLEEQAAQLLSQALEACMDIETNVHKSKILAQIANKYAEVGEADHVVHSLSQLLEMAQKTEKDRNKAILLATASSMYDKIGKQPSVKDKLILHDIVSTTDPMSLLRASTE